MLRRRLADLVLVCPIDVQRFHKPCKSKWSSADLARTSWRFWFNRIVPASHGHFCALVLAEIRLAPACGPSAAWSSKQMSISDCLSRSRGCGSTHSPAGSSSICRRRWVPSNRNSFETSSCAPAGISRHCARIRSRTPASPKRPSRYGIISRKPSLSRPTATIIAMEPWHS